MNAFLASLYILVGTYTGGGSDGIYVWKFNPETAQTTYVGMTRVENPSYLTASADGTMIYAVSENESAGAAVNALRFDGRMGSLALVDSELTGMIGEPASGGAPCNVITNGRLVVTANYLGGEVSVFEVQGDGTLSPMVQRLTLASSEQQEGVQDGHLSRKSHMHCVKFSPDGKYLFATDLGTDKLLRWNLARRPLTPRGGADELPGNSEPIDAGSLKTFDLPEKSGPRHFIFDATGENIYLINELAGTVVAFDYNGGAPVQRGLVDADPADGHGSADIVLSPDGRFLYASNRLKNDGISIFEVGSQPAEDEMSSSEISALRSGGLRADGFSEAKPILTPAGYKTTANHPRNLALSPDGRFMLVSCTHSDAVQIFAVNPATGALTPTEFALDISRPSCVLFVEEIEL